MNGLLKRKKTMSSRQLEGTERLQASAKGGDNRVSNDSRGVGILVVNDSDPELKRLVTLIESVSGIIVGLPSSAATVVRGVSSANPLIDALTILLNHARAAEVSDFGKLAKGLPKVIVLDAYLPERPGGPPNLVSSQKVLDLVEEIWSCFLDVSKGLLGNSEWNLVVLQYTEMLPRLVADASKPRNSRDWLGFAQKGDLAVVSDSAGLEANYLAAQINRLLSEDKTKGAGAEEIFLYLGMVGQA